MSYSVIIQIEALKELSEAYHYYEDQQLGLGKTFVSDFKELALRIENNPHIFQKIYKEKRRGIIQRFHYNVIYEVEKDIIRISAIMHSSRNPSHWQERE